MKFIGENVLRLNRETVMRALVESFAKTYMGDDLAGVEMIYHSNGDISLTFEQRGKKPKPVSKSVASGQEMQKILSDYSDGPTPNGREP